MAEVVERPFVQHLRQRDHALRLPTGHLCIHDHPEASMELRPGEYGLFLRAFNLGAESDVDLPDDVFLAREDLERYELFVVPGASPSEGVIAGKPTLW